MLKAGYGKIINMASMSNLIVPHPQHGDTESVADFGARNFTMVRTALPNSNAHMSHELAPIKR